MLIAVVTASEPQTYLIAFVDYVNASGAIEYGLIIVIGITLEMSISPISFFSPPPPPPPSLDIGDAVYRVVYIVGILACFCCHRLQIFSISVRGVATQISNGYSLTLMPYLFVILIDIWQFRVIRCM